MSLSPHESEVRNVNLPVDDATRAPDAATTAPGYLPASRESGLPEVHGREVRPDNTRDRRVVTDSVNPTGTPPVSAQSTAGASLDLLDTIRAIADPDAIPLIPVGRMPL